jgi:type I restriction enzyme S subunit
MKSETVSLGEVCTVVMGQSPPGTSYNTSGDGLPFFQGKTDFGDMYPKVRVFCNQPSRIAEEGDILMSVRAPVGPTNLAKEKCCIGRGLAALRIGTRLDTSFLLYFLRHHEPRLASQGQGSTFDAINRDDLEEIEIPLPALPEQQRIAGRLEHADRLRQTRRYALELTDTFLPAAFLELFGDPLSNPKKWPERCLGDVLLSAQDGPHVSPNYCTQGIPFLSTRNVRPGELVWDDLKYISVADAQAQWRKVKPERDDILYTKGGTTGMAKVVDFDKDVAVWVHIAVLKLRKEVVVPVWLEHMLNSRFCYQQSQELTFGIVNRDLGLKRMPRIRIYLPPLPLQRKFAALVEQAQRLRAAQREALRQAEHLFSSLLDRAFNADHDPISTTQAAAHAGASQR